jgi:hypothetical protein
MGRIPYINGLDQNCDPLRPAFFAGIVAIGMVWRPIELNGAHFDPEMVSLPLRLIPMNIVPSAQGRG